MDVEESRVKRLEKQQSRYRDRGGLVSILSQHILELNSILTYDIEFLCPLRQTRSSKSFLLEVLTGSPLPSLRRRDGLVLTRGHQFARVPSLQGHVLSSMTSQTSRVGARILLPSPQQVHQKLVENLRPLLQPVELNLLLNQVCPLRYCHIHIQINVMT